MKKSELRQIVREMIQEELASVSALNEAADLQEEVKLDFPCYLIKVWDSIERRKSGFPRFNSEKSGKTFKEFEDVVAALQTSEFSDYGAYEIIRVGSQDDYDKYVKVK
jgi:hypothetical protein